MIHRTVLPILLLTLCCLAPLGCSDSPPEVKIEEVKEGEGPAAKVGDMVDVHYTGTLTNGKTFDTSVGKEPYRFRIGMSQVIQGWHDGIPGMKVGGKRRLIIPAALGYGARGAGGAIPPNATLIFDVELLGVR